MIAKEIYEGKTAKELGLSETEYSSRKELLDSFVLTWDGKDFERSYRLWTYGRNTSAVKRQDTTAKEKAKDFVSTLRRVAKSGFALSDDELQKKRLDICKSCEHYNGKFCRVCGCYMRLKTRLEQARCPRNLWE